MKVGFELPLELVSNEIVEPREWRKNERPMRNWKKEKTEKYVILFESDENFLDPRTIALVDNWILMTRQKIEDSHTTEIFIPTLSMYKSYELMSFNQNKKMLARFFQNEWNRRKSRETEHILTLVELGNGLKQSW